MVHIAICEDDPRDAETLVDFLSGPLLPGIEHQYDYFRNGAELLGEYKDGCRPFDIVLLDMELPDMTGLEIAAQIRRSDQHVTIIFITVHGESEYTIAGYSFPPVYYIQKPVTKAELVKAINGATKSKQAVLEKRLIHRTKKGVISIPESEIVYLEVNGRYMSIVTVADRGQGHDPIRASMNEKLAQLSSGFMKINRHCAVNLYHIREFNTQDRTLTMSNEDAFQVSVRKLRMVVDALTDQEVLV